MIDRIRKLELAVIEAAIEWQRSIQAERAEGFHAPLSDAIEALNFGCPECNAGGHTCPGDGNAIPHGAGSCGEHDDPPMDTAEWVATTFLHIRTDDRVRIGQEEATVILAQVQEFHAMERGWVPTGEKKPDGTDKMTMQVDGVDHWEVRAALLLAGGTELPLSPFPPETAVEILCTPERAAQLSLSEAGFIGTTEV